MIFDPQQFVNVSTSILQSINYSFIGIHSVNVQQMNKVLQSIDLLDKVQSQEFWGAMAHIYSCDTEYIKLQYQLLKTNSITSETQSDTASLSEESSQKRNMVCKFKSDSILSKKNQIRNALVQVVNQYSSNKIESSLTDKDLCILVNKIVENDVTQKFWNKVAALVPSKSKKQIYDFYHTSFSKALFDQQVSREDRDLILQLNQLYPNEKPSTLAAMFLEKTGKLILKHIIIMYFVNLRRNK
ncbi:Homeobox-like_domain superfamily [Hexamita inflata]|uniref:Homeobox-like_domain superfamily n=1 Tax=Hexamita inflata TaxID=28002 RepID=A0ABP1GFT7_9EUKA